MSLTNLAINEAFEDGRFSRQSWVKQVGQTTANGIWFDLSMSPGNPPAQYYFATPLEARAMAHSTDRGLNHGPPVAAEGYRKFLHSFTIQTVLSTAAPLTVYLLDYLAYWTGLSMDPSGVVPLITAIDIPRWPNAPDLDLMVVEQSPYSLGNRMFRVSYLGQNGITYTSYCYSNSQISSGTIVTSDPLKISSSYQSTGLFVNTDAPSGPARATGFQMLQSDTGLLTVVLVKPIATFQINETTAPHYYDMQRDFGYLPEIKDDAYLNLVALPVGTLSSARLIGDITTIWSPA